MSLNPRSSGRTEARPIGNLWAPVYQRRPNQVGDGARTPRRLGPWRSRRRANQVDKCQVPGGGSVLGVTAPRQPIRDMPGPSATGCISVRGAPTEWARHASFGLENAQADLQLDASTFGEHQQNRQGTLVSAQRAQVERTPSPAWPLGWACLARSRVDGIATFRQHDSNVRGPCPFTKNGCLIRSARVSASRQIDKPIWPATERNPAQAREKSRVNAREIPHIRGVPSAVARELPSRRERNPSRRERHLAQMGEGSRRV